MKLPKLDRDRFISRNARKATKTRFPGAKLPNGLLIPLGLGLVYFIRAGLRYLNEETLDGQVALVTGGSRGLGFLIARELARNGCRLVICARDPAELARAGEDLIREGVDVLAIECDVTDRAQVDRMIEEATRIMGRIDVLVNNAGFIQVGPMQTMTVADFEEAMNIMFWGVVYPVMAVVPQMQARRRGRILNVTSVGGKVSVPHLLPYSAAKFAATGFSEGLRAELAEFGIKVTTIAPGLMRTGSYLNAYFKGDQPAEFTWFALGDNMPFVSMDAERAARQIVHALKHGDAEHILSIPANLLSRFNGLFPGLTSDMMTLVNRYILPSNFAVDRSAARGMEVENMADSPTLDGTLTVGESAAKRFHQYPGPVNVPAPNSAWDGDKR